MNFRYKWIKIRTYCHFDNKIQSEYNIYQKISKINIAKHAFYPLIEFTVMKRKRKFNTKIKKHRTYRKERNICYSSHTDSHIYSYYAHNLVQLYENKIDELDINECVLAFRSIGKNTIHYARDCFIKIKELQKCTVLSLDIKNFFGSLNHQILKRKILKVLNKNTLPNDWFNIFKSVTKYSFVNKKNINELIEQKKFTKLENKYCSFKEFRKARKNKNLLIKTNKELYGIPQGTPISALFSNIYMIDSDVFCNDLVKKYEGFYSRYCDDIIIIIPSNNINDIKDKIIYNIKENLQLEINSAKTDVINFKYENKELITDNNKSLQYLGFIFNGQSINIRSSSYDNFLRKMNKGIKYIAYFKFKHIRNNYLDKKLIYEKYSRFNKSSDIKKGNFITYAKRACKIFTQAGLDCKPINKLIYKSYVLLSRRITKLLLEKIKY